MGYGKVGFGKDEMRSYKLSHNSAVHTITVRCTPITGPKEGFEGVSKPNQDKTGVQIFLRKPKEKKSTPSFN